MTGLIAEQPNGHRWAQSSPNLSLQQCRCCGSQILDHVIEQRLVGENFNVTKRLTSLVFVIEVGKCSNCGQSQPGNSCLCWPPQQHCATAESELGRKGTTPERIWLAWLKKQSQILTAGFAGIQTEPHQLAYFKLFIPSTIYHFIWNKS